MRHWGRGKQCYMIGINILSDPVPSVRTHECCFPGKNDSTHFHKVAIINICLITISEMIKGVAYSEEHTDSMSHVCQEIVLAATQKHVL